MIQLRHYLPKLPECHNEAHIDLCGIEEEADERIDTCLEVFDKFHRLDEGLLQESNLRYEIAREVINKLERMGYVVEYLARRERRKLPPFEW